jgi:hypothetical protein
MSDLNEKIKLLLSKAKETGDMELLDLATDLLNTESQQSDQKPIKKTTSQPESRFEEFSMNDSNVGKMSQSVDVQRRENKFVDHGTEHKDDQNATPQIELTERKRPAFKKITQTCTRCNRGCETHPQFKRDFYICDRCLRK